MPSNSNAPQPLAQAFALTLDSIDLKIISDSGQCFRWYALNPSEYLICDGSSAAIVAQSEPQKAVVKAAFGEPKDWHHYFDSAHHYTALESALIAEDQRLKPIIEASRGLRLLNQDPLEILVTFMMSANNHIPRIRSFMLRLCEGYGTELGQWQGRGVYGFPTLQKLASLTEQDYVALGAGYRGRYLAATMGRLSADPDYLNWHALEDTELRERLMDLMGVGRKVADCVALFGYGRWTSFPVDTWIKQLAVPWLDLPEKVADRVVLEAFTRRYGDHRGLVQQYLFYYYRIHGGLA